MYKYQKKMKELGYTEETLSKSVLAKLQEFKVTEPKIMAALASAKQANNTAQVTEIENDLDAMDNDLANKIANIAKHAETARKMQEGRLAKKSGAPAAAPAPKVSKPASSPTPAAAPAPVETPEVVIQEEPPVVIAEAGAAVEGEEKKSSGLGWLLGTVAVVGLGVLGIKAMNKQ